MKPLHFTNTPSPPASPKTRPTKTYTAQNMPGNGRFARPTIWKFQQQGEAFGEMVTRFASVTAKRLAPTRMYDDGFDDET